MRTVVFLLEELSARVLLEGLLPRVLPDDVVPRYVVFEGKSDLERNLARKIRGWQAPNSHFVVLRDQDSTPDCRVVKDRLVQEVTKSGRPALVRVACRTLEAWVAGDLDALATGFDKPKVAEKKAVQKFRNPDLLGDPIHELRQLVPEYQKVDGARKLGTLLEPTQNTSPSFRAFCAGLARLLAPGVA